MYATLRTIGCAIALTLATASAGAATLDDVKARGTVNCGIAAAGLPGYSVTDDKGNWVGFNIDYCRAVAVAIFNDPSKVKFVPLTSKDRFTALQAGEVDLLVNNTTWSMSRDTALGLQFMAVNFYDGQGFMVRKTLGVQTAFDLKDASVCVVTGTTTELNLADFFRVNNLKYEPVVFVDANEALKAYDGGRCDAYTTDSTGLYAYRVRLTNPAEHVILPTIISKEPLGPVWRQGDDQWGNIIKWTHYALVTAEELGITRANVIEAVKTDKRPDVMRLLGVEGKFGEGIGLPNDWAYRIIKAVGNYGEVFERNLGENTPLGIKRGVNALWTKGGLQYAPPIR